MNWHIGIALLEFVDHFIIIIKDLSSDAINSLSKLPKSKLVQRRHNMAKWLRQCSVLAKRAACEGKVPVCTRQL